jgi:hypothetical protein
VKGARGDAAGPPLFGAMPAVTTQIGVRMDELEGEGFAAVSLRISSYL